MSARMRQLTDASTLFQSGHLDRAASKCRRVLARNPRDADAMQLMGLISARQGGIASAVQWIGNAVQVAGPRLDLCLNLARLLQAQGHLESAVACYFQAIEVAPTNASIWLSLGRLLMSLGRPEAAACFRQVLEFAGSPAEAAEAQMQLGNLHHASGDPAAAAECYESVLLSDPASADACFNLGVVRTMQNHLDEARAAYEQAVRLRPDYAEAHNNLAILDQLHDQRDDAMRRYRHAIYAKPDYEDPYYNLGLLLQNGDQPESALVLYDELIARNPNHADAHNNRGNALLAMNRVPEARLAYETAVRLRQGHAEAHWNLALVHLLMGDYANGWREYDWRLLRDPNSVPHFEQPFWDGSNFEGKTLLVHAEQGMGDTVQFIRYAQAAKQRGGDLVFLCPAPLTGLLSHCAGVDAICPDREQLPSFDYHVPLLSLPRILGARLENLPADIPYVHPERPLVRQWAKVVADRCADPGDWRVGLAWRGNPRHQNDRNRSAPDSFVQQLGCPKGVTLFSLQKDGGVIPSNLIPLGEEMTDFADTAAVLANLDLVVSVDTAVAHLAGALGRSVWTLLAYAPDWRWMLDREDTPWYPTMRLLRQSAPRNWEHLAARLQQDFKQMIGMSAGPRR